MIAAQKINQISAPVFGIVSTGMIWEFGMLNANHFIKEIKIYTIQNLKLLFAALNYMFEQSKLQLVL
jgi:hypothetical protein